VEVKPQSHRERQAQATRQAVAEAARPLFAHRGYTSTTIEAISAAADIPVQTIYSAFGSKRNILEEARTRWIEEAEVAELYGRAMAMEKLGDRLSAVAHWTRREFELGHDLIAADQEASRVDPDAAVVWRRALDGREAALTKLLSAGRPTLKRGVTVRRGVDILITCTLPEIYRHLVLERGWTADEYERWLARVLRNELG